MNQSLDDLTDTLGRFDDVLRTELKQFETGAAETATVMANAQDAVETHHKALADHVRDAARALAGLQSNLSARSAEAVASMKAATLALESGSAALGDFNEITPGVAALKTQLGKVEQLAGNLDGLSARLATTMEQAADGMADQLASATKDGAERVASAVQHSANSIQTAGQSASTDLQETAKSFESEAATTARRLTQALQDFRLELARLTADQDAS
jgi:hypothetical protein